MKITKSLLFAALLAAFSQTMPSDLYRKFENISAPANGEVRVSDKALLGVTTDSRPASKQLMRVAKPGSDLRTNRSARSVSKEQLAKDQFAQQYRSTLRTGQRRIADAGAAVNQANKIVHDEEKFLGTTPDSRPPVDDEKGFLGTTTDSRPPRQALLGGDGTRPYQRTLTPKTSGKPGNLGFRKYRGNETMLGTNPNTYTPKKYQDNEVMLGTNSNTYTPTWLPQTNSNEQAQSVLVGGKGSWSPVKWSPSDIK